MSVLERSYTQLLPTTSSDGGIDYNQTAPTGFLLLTKLCSSLFGENEYVLRLFPFLSAIFSLLLILYFSVQLLSPGARPITLFLVATFGQYIYYSSSLKQYSSDVFWTMLIYALAIPVYKDRRISILRALLLGSVGAVGIWFSHPIIFVLAGVGGILGLSWIVSQQHRRHILPLLLAYFLWIVSFGIRYFLFLRLFVDHETLLQFWGNRFMPLPPTSLEDFGWFTHIFFETVGYLFGMPMFTSFFDILRQIERIGDSLLGISPSIGLSLTEVIDGLAGNIAQSLVYGIGSILIVVGGWRMGRRRILLFMWLFSPVLLNLLASAFYKYPFGNRMILFITPALFCFLGEGAVWLRQHTRTHAPLLGILCVAFLCAYPGGQAFNGMFHPRKHEEARPVLQYWNAQKQEKDLLYVYYASETVFTYYARLLDAENDKHIQGIASREDWRKYIDDLNQLRGHSRVWLFFSHAYNEEAFFIAYLDSIGDQLDVYQDVRASVYLYNLQ